MKEILKMLGQMDKKQISEAVNKAKEFANTPEGKNLVEKLKRGENIEGIPVNRDEQNKIISEISKNPEVAKKIAELLGGKE